MKTAILFALLSLFAFVFSPRSASAQGRAVSCGCYCGKVLPPPCSDDACKSACGWGGGSANSYGGEPPMAGVPWGGWTKQISRNVGRNYDNCGSNPLCLVMATGAGAIAIPIGLVVDMPVFIVKGLGYGLYYGAAGTGKGLRAIGRGIAYPFRKKPKPVQEIYAAPPATPPAADCAGVAAEQEALLAEERAEAEKFNQAIVRSQLDQGVGKLKDEVAGVVSPLKDAAEVKDFAAVARDFHRDTRNCVAAGGTKEVFLGCVDAVNKLYGDLLGKLAGADKVEAAKDAMSKYASAVLDKTLPLVEKAAKCQGR